VWRLRARILRREVAWRRTDSNTTDEAARAGLAPRSILSTAPAVRRNCSMSLGASPWKFCGPHNHRRPSNGHRRPLLHPLGADALPRDPRRRYLRAKRSMMSLNIGSFTFSAACEAESHLTTRSCFSGHCLFWRLTSNGKTRTSQTTTPPFFIRFSYENEPAARLATAPTTPASSKASRAAEYWGTCPFSASPSE
jgi:hypothetical protein